MRLLTFSEITIQVSAMVLVITLVHKLFHKKMTPNVKYFLWIFAALRILLPLAFEIHIEVPSFVYEQVADIKYDDLVQEEIGNVHNIQNPEEGIFANSQPVSDQKLQPIPSYEQHETGLDDQQLTNVFSMLWLFGAFILSIYIAINNLEISAYLKENRRKADKKDECIDIYYVKGYNCLAGIFRPAIYVDSEHMDSQTVCKSIIQHELQHYKAKDHIWQFVRVVCLILQWYNPIVWYAYFASKQDCELACDYRTVRNMTNEQRREYGTSLLSISSGLNKNPKLTIATSVGDNKKFLENRIRTIMQSKYRGAMIFSVMLICIICAVSLIGVISVNLIPKKESTENNKDITDIKVKRIVERVPVTDFYNDYVDVVLYEGIQGEYQIAFIDDENELSLSCWTDTRLNEDTKITYHGSGKVSYKFQDESGKKVTCGLYYENVEWDYFNSDKEKRFEWHGQLFTPVDPLEITQRRYEHNGSYIEFLDMPKTDAETLACSERMFEIICDEYTLGQYWFEQSRIYAKHFAKELMDNTDKVSQYEYIIVKDVHEMTFEELKELDDSEKLLHVLFASLIVDSAPNMGLYEYIQMILNNGCKIVAVEFDSKYRENAASASADKADINASIYINDSPVVSPLAEDGENIKLYWLIIPDPNGQYRIWDWSGQIMFNSHRFQDPNKIPEILKRSINNF